jgi:hypothetical protein
MKNDSTKTAPKQGEDRRGGISSQQHHQYSYLLLTRPAEDACVKAKSKDFDKRLLAIDIDAIRVSIRVFVGFLEPVLEVCRPANPQRLLGAPLCR